MRPICGASGCSPILQVFHASRACGRDASASRGLIFWSQRRVSVAGRARHGGVVLKEQDDDFIASFFAP
jgi:hypothetical protein